MALQALQEAEEAPQLNHELRVISVKTRIEKVLISKPSEESWRVRSGRFEFEADLSEVRRSTDTMTVRYAFTFGRAPARAACQVSGEAVVRFSHLDSDLDLQSLGSRLTTQMAVEIFREDYESIYLLHGSLRMEAPSPWIVQEILVS